MGAARSRRRGGWWGVAFIVTLAVSAGMVSLPTSTQSGALIAGFYRAHAAVILVQQVLGVLSLVFFLAFARALGAGRRRWLLVGTVLVAVTEIATNVLPAVLALSNPAPWSTNCGIEIERWRRVMWNESAPGEKLLTKGEVAQLCRVEIRTVDRWVAAGKIKCYRIPSGRLLFRQSDVLLATDRRQERVAQNGR